MKDYINKLYSELEEELAVYADLGTLPVRRLTGALSSISETVTKLKEYVTANPFKDVKSEIDFFKNEKPRFIAEQIYALEIFTIETSRPITDSQLLKAYYQQELLFIKRIFEQYKFLYSYYQYEMKELDHLLFVRGAAPSDIPLPEYAGIDKTFSTSGDYLFARFIAYERLQTYLLDEMESLERPIVSSKLEASPDTPALIWTGESINLVELAYGIWLTGQINNGNAGITEIIQWLELNFQIKIGRAYRRWQSISKRKRVSQVKFIDEIRAAVLKRLDHELI